MLGQKKILFIKLQEEEAVWKQHVHKKYQYLLT